MSQNKQRIVILGGGVSALASAWELTNQPDWQSRYDIAVYQLGWRLGGKCASGRGPYGRIEEHGIHVLMGFYDNVFDILQSCYSEINRPPQAPIATWQEAVAPQSNVVLMENVRGHWLPWQFKFRTNGKIPGASKTRRHPHAVLYALLRQMLAIHHQSPLHRSKTFAAHRALTEANGSHRQLKEAIEVLNPDNANSQLGDAEKQDILASLDEFLKHLLAMPLVQHALCVSKADAAAPQRPIGSQHHGLAHIVEACWHEAEKFVCAVENDVFDPILRDIRRVIIQLKMGFAMVHGIFCDHVLTMHGWDFAAINHLDLRQWMGQNLAGLPGDHLETLDSAPVRGVYDLVFGYTEGVPGQYALEAGTSLDFMLRIVFEYKGAVYWKMQAGMGDVVLAPLYLTLKKRGVKFHFFHSVQAVKLSEQGDEIGSVELGVQLKAKGEEYDPLFEVKGLPCYPSEPLYERLDMTPAEEAELKALQSEFNGLESPWTTWKNRDTLTLNAGHDFDRVILGISIAALRKLCPELAAANPAWQKMLDSVQTTATQSAQMWLKPTLQECGWNRGVCVMDAYAEMMNTWTDMSDLLPREEWPEEYLPGSIAYFTGPLPNQSTPPPYSEQGYPVEQLSRVETSTRVWMQENVGPLFPKAVIPHTQGLDFDVLIDPENREGEARFDAQYWRANVNPSDHYVLSVPGSSQFRLAPGNSGFSNLILTGDWTLNGMNAGSVEAAATSGVLAAHALLDTL